MQLQIHNIIMINMKIRHIIINIIHHIIHTNYTVKYIQNTCTRRSITASGPIITTPILSFNNKLSEILLKERNTQSGPIFDVIVWNNGKQFNCVINTLAMDTYINCSNIDT
eukprot:418114_1